MTVVGISVDSAAKARKFVNKHQIDFPIYVDPGGAAAKAWNVLDNDIAKPATFIVEATGSVIYARVGASASDRPSVAALLEFLTANPAR